MQFLNRFSFSLKDDGIVKPIVNPYYFEYELYFSYFYIGSDSIKYELFYDFDNTLPSITTIDCIFCVDP
jgi:hypothetical protein